MMKYLLISFVLGLLTCIPASAENDDLDGPPIVQAIDQHSYEKVEALIKKGVELNESYKYHHPPLHIAALHGNTKIMKLLIDNGADPNFPDHRRQETPLNMAIDWGQAESVKFLLANGANIYEHALGQACFKNNFEIVQMLVQAGADVNSKVHWTPLNAAAQEASAKLLEYLLNQGADPNQASGGATPVAYAVLSDTDPEAKVKLLLENNARFNSPTAIYNWTPIQWAANEGNIAIIEMLLEAGADINQIDRDGKSLVEITEKERHFEAAKYLRALIEKGT